jgi:hypothetical protein
MSNETVPQEEEQQTATLPFGARRAVVIAVVVVVLGSAAFLLSLWQAANAPLERQVTAAAAPSDAVKDREVLAAGGGIVGANLLRAERALEQGRIVSPPGANVRAYIDEILAIDPGNGMAIGLVAKTKTVLGTAGDDALAKEQWGRAELLFDQIVQFDGKDADAKAKLALAKAGVGGGAGQP